MFEGVGWPCELRSISRTEAWSLSFLMNSSSRHGAGPAGQSGLGRQKSFARRSRRREIFLRLRQAVVPGDRVTIAFDPAIPGCRASFWPRSRRHLREAGVER